MTAEFEVAVRRLGARPVPETEQVWGWRGRTLSGTVNLGDTDVWLRLVSGRDSEIARTFWEGNLAAQRDLPTTVPRPCLLRRDEWDAHAWRYAAEVFEHVATPPLSVTPAAFESLRGGTPLPEWWAMLRSALDTVSRVSTDRFTIGPVWADQLVADHFGKPATGPHPWVPSHGDLHWANVARNVATGGSLVIFDWEGWGSGPVGYDAATLLVHSLLEPALAAQVRERYADVLAGEHGLYAQQVVVAEQLWRRRDTPNDPLLPALHEYAATLRR